MSQDLKKCLPKKERKQGMMVKTIQQRIQGNSTGTLYLKALPMNTGINCRAMVARRTASCTHNNNENKITYKIRFENEGWGRSNNWISYHTISENASNTYNNNKKKTIDKIRFIDGGGSEVASDLRISHYLNMSRTIDLIE